MTKSINIFTVQELTLKQKRIIRSTIPVLKIAGEALTTEFYENMFHMFPQVKILFDATNQKNLRQPKILAFALLKYAENIDDLTPLVGFVKNIVSKHVGLQIKPLQYVYVGEALIGTMGLILGANIDSDFIGAWSQAYANLAQLLINMENEVYKTLVWNGFKPFTVVKMVDECNDVKSVYLKPVDGIISPGVSGQYISVRFFVGEDFPIVRSYSLSNVDQYYRISVRKTGKISTFIHEQLKVGDKVTVAPPAGSFVFEDSDDISHFIIDGIGIAPVIPMLNDVLPLGKKINLYYSNKTGDRPFVNTLKTWKQQYNNFTVVEYIADVAGLHDPIDQVKFRRMGKTDLKSIEGKVYLLGPVEFVLAMKAGLNENGIEPKVEFPGPTVV